MSNKNRPVLERWFYEKWTHRSIPPDDWNEFATDLKTLCEPIKEERPVSEFTYDPMDEKVLIWALDADDARRRFGVSADTPVRRVRGVMELPDHLGRHRFAIASALIEEAP